MKGGRKEEVQAKNESECEDSYQSDKSSHQNSDLNIKNKSRRISDSKKEKLISLVTKHNYRIKEAGRLLGISYSTAKKIFANFRIDLRKRNCSEDPEEPQYRICRYCQLIAGENKRKNVEVVSSIAGQLQSVEAKNLDFDQI